jgi:dihydroorotate dehydrogenase (fumarate)
MTVDLSVSYLGLKLSNPFVVSSCPLTGRLDSAMKLQDSGAAAIILPSLFEEQIEHDEMQGFLLDSYGEESFAEATSYFPEMNDYNLGPETYLDKVEGFRKRLSIPVIASLNGTSPGGWTRYAKMFESAGAHAIELNVYIVPTDPLQSSSDIEQRYSDIVQSVREAVSIPLALKIGPYFSSLPHFAARMESLGVNGLSLFNRYLEPDINPEQMQVNPELVFSTPVEHRLPLRWIAILRPFLKLSLAATSGLHLSLDAVKLLMAGADVTMVAAVLVQRGPDYLVQLKQELTNWLTEHSFDSVRQMQGCMSHANAPDPSAYVRANYLRALTAWAGRII